MTIKRHYLYFLICIFCLPLITWAEKSTDAVRLQTIYTMTCNISTDLCPPIMPPYPVLTVNPPGASHYDFYRVDYNGIATLVQSGSVNEVLANFSSTSYYCEVTDVNGLNITNSIQIRWIDPGYWHIGRTTTTSQVCGSATFYMQPAIWDSYQWYRNGIAIPGATSAAFIGTLTGYYNCFVTNSCGGDTADAGSYIDVDPVLPAIPSITVTPGGSICAGQTITMSTSRVEGAQYNWYYLGSTGSTFNAGNGINKDTVKWTAYEGNVRYYVTMNNNCGTKYSSVISINVLQTINAVFSQSGPAQFCPGNNVTFSVSQQPGWNYQWQKNNVNIGGATLNSYTAAATGSYRINVTNGNGCANTFAKSVTATGPDAQTYATAPFCAGSTGYVYTPEGLGFTYQWYKNNIPEPGATNDSLAVTSATNGAFKVIVNSGCGIDTSVAQQFTFNPVPAATISVQGPLSFCSGDSAILTANSGTNYSYQWRKNGIPLNDGNYYNYHALFSGSYDVIVKTAPGCGTLSASVSVNSYSNPNPVVSANGPLNFCSGGSVILNTTPTSGANYQWLKNNLSISGSTSSSYTASVSGNYKIQKTNSNGCTGNSASKNITVYNLPVATVSPQGPTVFCAGDSVQLKANFNPIYSYQWKKNNVNIGGATSFKYEAKTAGNYKVKETNSNGCIALSATISVSVPCRNGVFFSEPENYFEVHVYPNPSSGNFNCDIFSENDQNTKLLIYNSMGSLVFEKSFGNGNHTISEAQLTSGFYKAIFYNGNYSRQINLIQSPK